jgi:hypothetical protein
LDGLVPPYHPRDVGLCAPDGPARGSDRGGGLQQQSTAPAHGDQPGRVQRWAWPGVPLSVQEIGRLLWRMVLAVQQTTHHIVLWSQWRRRHQALAKYYHDTRRGALTVL